MQTFPIFIKAMQTASFRISTHLTESTYYQDNRYTTNASLA